MNYIYLYPNYDQARTSFRDFLHRNVAVPYVACHTDLRVRIGADIHHFAVVPIRMDLSKIQGMVGKASADAVLAYIDELKERVKTEVLFMDARTTYHANKEG